MAAQCGVAGSTKIGRNCMFGGQSGFAGHITVADGTKCSAQSGIQSSVKQEGSTLMGSPAIPYFNYMRSYAIFKASGVKKDK